MTEHPVPYWYRSGPGPDAPLVVLCHSYGAEPRDWAERWPTVLALPVHILAPGGPYPFEIRRENKIRIGRAWYLYDGGEHLFRTTVEATATWLHAAIREIESEQGWSPRRRGLIGHSQGAYFGYVAALTGQEIFSHLVAVGGRLKEAFLSRALSEPGRLETLILHGNDDDSVPPEAAERSYLALRSAGYTVERMLLPGGHEISPAADRKAASWLRARLVSP